MRTFTLVLMTTALINQLAFAEIRPGDPYVEDRAALLQIKAEYEKAIKADSPHALEPFLAEGFSAVMVTGDAVNSFDDLNEYWQYIRDLIGDDGSYEVEVVHEPAQFSGNHALARGTTRETVTASGNTYQFESHWTAVLTRQPDGWKVLRLHASMNPIDNAFNRAALKSVMTRSAGGGLVIGLVISGLFFWLRSRRQSSNAAGKKH